MATIYTHAVLGLGIAQLYVPGRRQWLYWLLAAGLPVIPDFDVFSTAVYGTSMWGHRGITHTPIFALWFGFLTASLTFRLLRGNLWVLTGMFFAVIASHGVLDAFTRGGADIAFFWPATEARYGNWGPIPVSDLGFEFPDPRRSRSLRSELLWVWLPTAAWITLVTAFRLVRWHRRRRQPKATTRTGFTN